MLWETRSHVPPDCATCLWPIMWFTDRKAWSLVTLHDELSTCYWLDVIKRVSPSLNYPLSGYYCGILAVLSVVKYTHGRRGTPVSDVVRHYLKVMGR
jgi:hypothetical protein